MFTLTLAPDQPCDWLKIEQLLNAWNPSTRLQKTATKDEAHFSTQLPSDEQERLTALFDLQDRLTPHGVSFSLEIKP